MSKENVYDKSNDELIDILKNNLDFYLNSKFREKLNNLLVKTNKFFYGEKHGLHNFDTIVKLDSDSLSELMKNLNLESSNSIIYDKLYCIKKLLGMSSFKNEGLFLNYILDDDEDILIRGIIELDGFNKKSKCVKLYHIYEQLYNYKHIIPNYVLICYEGSEEIVVEVKDIQVLDSDDKLISINSNCYGNKKIYNNIYYELEISKDINKYREKCMILYSVESLEECFAKSYSLMIESDCRDFFKSGINKLTFLPNTQTLILDYRY